MTEELYIIVSGKSHKLDLNSPSGITLKYVSNLFNDISKISCSHSYTFKLPKTANNCRVLDMAEDIRHNSTMVRKKLKAVFMQNGVSLFRNANLYIESIDNAYQAVFTWDVISGMQALKDNDISLNSLPELGTTNYHRTGLLSEYYTEKNASLFSNVADVVYPFYYAGIKPENSFGAICYNILGTTFQSRLHNLYCGLPAVPIYRILSLINNYYGVNFKLGDKFSMDDWNDLEGNYDTNEYSDLINRGVVPLVNWELIADHSKTLRAGLRFSNTAEKWNNRLHLLFRQYIAPTKGDMFKSEVNSVPASDGATLYNGIKATYESAGCDLELDGVIIARYKTQLTEPQLKIYSITAEGIIEVASLDAVETSSGDTYVYRYDFRADYGNNRLSISGEYVQYDKPIYITLPNVVPTFLSSEIYFYPLFTPDHDASRVAIWLSITKNLPDISCMTFIKSLYYMIGAFPAIDSDGNIIAINYNKLKENLNSGIIYDWSKKAQSQSWESDYVKFDIGGFAQKNYFLMKNDNLGEYKKERDFYERGKGCITVSNETLEPSKTIFQIPFYGKFQEDLQYYYINTGDTVKMWEKDGNEVSPVESKPAIGIIKGTKWYNYFPTRELDDEGNAIFRTEHNGQYILSMDVWDGFKNISKNDSYAYLQSILKNPIAIKENFLLNELDLRDLDYTVPIYLEKYNSYFAIITLERDSKGICKAELIKLPNT